MYVYIDYWAGEVHIIKYLKNKTHLHLKKIMNFLDGIFVKHDWRQKDAVGNEMAIQEVGTLLFFSLPVITIPMTWNQSQAFDFLN